MNSFGKRLVVTTFGESHGPAIGCVIDGLPAGLEIDVAFIQGELERRRPGKSRYATARKEEDRVEILSGLFEGRSTGTPMAMVIFNQDQRSRDYSAIKELFRPGHADFTYHQKYGIRDYRGGGRSSARETAARVAAGAVAKLLLGRFGISVEAGVMEVAGIEGRRLDFQHARQSPICALDPEREGEQREAILAAKQAHDSVGGAVLVRARGVPAGLGEPLYHKLDAALAGAMMGINAVKAVEIGLGIEAARLRGSQNNDPITKEGFAKNDAGGILGGISTGEEILVKIWFKPTPSIFQKQRTINEQGEEVELQLQGRHDPFVAARGSVVAEAMMALVLADMLLLNATSRLEWLERIYRG
ncbi:MAG: chorismate synthase [Nitratiruptor sp.]|nr:chorismate synthase [Nitratiruptor sp.]NPA83604.1 chorismate synthase [Campylobacterota bacterium]